MARYKRDTAWVRSIIERSVVLGVPTPPGVLLETLVVEELPLEYIRTLHSLFLAKSVSAAVAEAVAEAHAAPASQDEHEHAVLAVSLPPTAAEHSGDASTSAVAPVTQGATTQLVVSAEAGRSLKVPPNSSLAMLSFGARKLWGMLARACLALGAAHAGRAPNKATFFLLDERKLLIKQMLHWAKHSHGTHVYEPRESQMRWRTEHDWKSLLAHLNPGDALRPFDQTELSAYQTVAFLYSDYSHHAWYWCVRCFCACMCAMCDQCAQPS